jgi:hypothetical protein
MKKTITKDERIRKQIAVVQAGFIKNGTSLYKYCAENNISKSSAFRALNHRLKSEASQKLRQQLIDASKGKTGFQPQQEAVKNESVN